MDPLPIGHFRKYRKNNYGRKGGGIPDGGSTYKYITGGGLPRVVSNSDNRVVNGGTKCTIYNIQVRNPNIHPLGLH